MRPKTFEEFTQRSPRGRWRGPVTHGLTLFMFLTFSVPAVSIGRSNQEEVVDRWVGPDKADIGADESGFEPAAPLSKVVL